jgi:prevent-host-death family protein
MDEVGLREMRQHASDLVRRAEAGERVTITVSGRPAAMIGPLATGAWRHWSEVADIFTVPVDEDWAHDRDLVDNTLQDPWEHQ